MFQKNLTLMYKSKINNFTKCFFLKINVCGYMYSLSLLVSAVEHNGQTGTIYICSSLKNFMVAIMTLLQSEVSF
jgi:hypothetical protein